MVPQLAKEILEEDLEPSLPKARLPGVGGVRTATPDEEATDESETEK